MQHHAWDGAQHAEGAGRQHRSIEPSGPGGSESGAAVVEFSLVLTLVVLLVFGVVQFGGALNKYQGMQAAAREGARFGAKSQSTVDGIQQRVKQSLEVVDTGAASLVDPCPSDPKTLAADKVCINVAVRDATGATPTLLTVAGYRPATQPCNLGAGKTVLVSIYHTIPIRIPVWPATTVTAESTGEFRCES